jgi:acetoin utilization deacetylase AcuC-like enzyme
MRVIWSPTQSLHALVSFVERGSFSESPETPQRAEFILKEAAARGHSIERPDDQGLDPILAVHDADYVAFLRNAHDLWTSFAGEGTRVLPNVHPRGAFARQPRGPVGLLGWYTGDMASEIAAQTWAAAYDAAQSAAWAASLLMAKRETVYALCRPPGHHAGRDRAMGFCYLNNAAVAAEVLRKHHRRVAILDVDVHHGNGTQEIFYEREDVFFASIHADPAHYYPFFWGYPEQTGVEDGEGTTLNVPFAVGSGDGPFLDALAVALDGISRFSPGALVLSLGTDASIYDVHGGHAVTDDGFRQMAERIAGLGLPTVVVQEGGYASAELGTLVVDILESLT